MSGTAGALAPIAGGSPEADGMGSGGDALAGNGAMRRFSAPIEVILVAVVFAAASVFFGIFPSPLFNLVAHAGHAVAGLF